MEIIRFDKKYLDEMVRLFLEAYDEPDAHWDYETSEKFLLRCLETAPEFCFSAIDEKNTCLGSIFCRIDPYYTGKMLWMDSIQVQPKYRERGVAKTLLAHLATEARKTGFSGIHFIADDTKDFPKKWYESLGFEKSGWVEYEATLDNINI